MAVAAGGGEVGADAAVALEGCQGAPAAADFRGDLIATDGVLGSVVRGRDVVPQINRGRDWLPPHSEELWVRTARECLLMQNRVSEECRQRTSIWRDDGARCRRSQRSHRPWDLLRPVSAFAIV